MQKKCYIIAGPNGAGKTTFANDFLPFEVECLNFINADLIAAGLSPYQPEKIPRDYPSYAPPTGLVLSSVEW